MISKELLESSCNHRDEPLQQPKPVVPDWEPVVPDWEPEISSESPGGRARRLWEDVFEETKKIAGESISLFTGIGGAVAAGRESRDLIRRFPDGAVIPRYLDLKREFGCIPLILFLVASLRDAADVIALRGLAREYKEQGVGQIIAVLTALYHERQDHKFYDKMGKLIQEVTSLEDTVEILAERRYIDGVLLIQPHSKRPIDLGLRNGIPILPIDPFNLLFHEAGFNQIAEQKRFVMGPDKGRRDTARRTAFLLKCPQASAEKTRARLRDGYPEISIPKPTLDYIKANKCVVYAVDDEIRQGGTLYELAEALQGIASELRVCVTKLFAAGRAVQRLQHSFITEIISTNAVAPINDLAPIKDKLRIIRLEPQIEKLIEYLQKKLTDRNNPKWLGSLEETGTYLELDLRVERYD